MRVEEEEEPVPVIALTPPPTRRYWRASWPAYLRYQKVLYDDDDDVSKCLLSIGVRTYRHGSTKPAFLSSVRSFV